MHRSRLGGLIIDCEGGDLDAATEFWSRALGYPRRQSTRPEDGGYGVLETAPDEPHIEVQRVDHPSRVHLDIETDDVEAEVRRLEALGARGVKRVRDWVVMEAPTGHRFCVVPAARADFARRAKVWSD
jgi:catechol 2,3-dioxygenase-like lactoylglutathione lyase family enzyme